MKRNLLWSLILTAVLAVGYAGSIYAEGDGSAADPIRTDPTGTTSQPVDDNAGSLTIDNAALSVTGGGVEASALRVTIANDSTGLLSIDDNGSSLSVDDNAGSLTIDNAALAVTGGGVEASALRVTIANDSTGLLSVDDNGSTLSIDDGGGSITVDGTVTTSPVAPRETYVARVDVDPRASTDYLNVFNATSSGQILRIHGIRVVTDHTGNVTGTTIPYTVATTTTAGTTCTAVTINPLDSTNTAVPAQVTANSDCTTDPTIDFDLLNCAVRSEENPNGGEPPMCLQFNGNSDFQPITLRETEGIVLQQNAISPNANVDSVIATIIFSMSAT